MDSAQKTISESFLEEYLLKHIPISSAMGVGVVLASQARIVLKAPFTNNINHKQTVFGGSLHAVATLACWSLLHVNFANLYFFILLAFVTYPGRYSASRPPLPPSPQSAL